MGKITGNSVFDAACNHVKNNCTLLVLCEGQPTTFAEANLAKGSGGLRLAAASMAPADFVGPADGNTSGRKIETVQKTGATVDAVGNGNHIAYVDVPNSDLLHVTRETEAASGTAQAGTATTLTLDAGDAAPDDTYVGMTIRFTGGTGAGEDFGIITDHTAGVITVASAFGTTPDATTQYSIYGIDVPSLAGTVTFQAGRIEFRDPDQ